MRVASWVPDNEGPGSVVNPAAGVVDTHGVRYTFAEAAESSWMRLPDMLDSFHSIGSAGIHLALAALAAHAANSDGLLVTTWYGPYPV